MHDPVNENTSLLENMVEKQERIGKHNGRKTARWLINRNKIILVPFKQSME